MARPALCEQATSVAMSGAAGRRAGGARTFRDGEQRGCSGRGATQLDRDRGRRFPCLGGEFRDPARRQAEGRTQDVDGGDPMAAGVVDGRRDGIESQLVFTDGGRIAAPPRPSQFLQERLKPHARKRGPSGGRCTPRSR